MTWRKTGAGLLAFCSLGVANAGAASPELTEQQLVGTLQKFAAGAPAMDATALAQLALANIKNNPGPSATQQLSWDALKGLAQLTVEINFEYDSVAIVPESYRAIGLIADALHHPVLLGYTFLVVGHTDAKGDRTYNLTLSQKRADAIRDVLTTTFAIAPNRVTSVGVGEEQLIDPGHPDDAINRRVQVINIGSIE